MALRTVPMMLMLLPLLLPRMLAASEDIPGLSLPEGYTAEVLFSGVGGVDGLALSCSGLLYAAAESEGAVYVIDGDGNAEVLTRELRNPEGIACDDSGCVYVTEDVDSGRVVRLDGSGGFQVMFQGTMYSEGITVSEDGTLFFTGSSLESGAFPPVLTDVLELDEGAVSVIHSSLFLWSYSDLAIDDGVLYVCNETAGFAMVTASLIRIEVDTGNWSIFCSGLTACEGICPTPGSFFPLYVAEEDVGNGSGRISIVREDGSTQVFAEGFRSIEDVAVDPSGNVYVSEDATGSVILLRNDRSI